MKEKLILITMVCTAKGALHSATDRLITRKWNGATWRAPQSLRS